MYIFIYVSLYTFICITVCICVCILSMRRALKHTDAVLGSLSHVRWAGYPSLPGAAHWGWFSSMGLRPERWSLLLAGVRFRPTRRILCPPSPSAFQLRSLAALNAMVKAKWSIIGFYRIQQDYHYVVKYGVVSKCVNFSWGVILFLLWKSIHLLKCVWEAHDLHCYGQCRMAIQNFFASLPWASS